MRMMILAILIPLAACGNGGDDTPGIAASGTGTTRSFAVAGFDGIDLRGPDDIDVRVGAAFSVRAEGDQEALDTLKVEKVGQTLRIGRRGFSWGGSKGKAHIYVTMPRIAAAGIAGSGNLSVDRAEGSKFEGDVAGSGNLAVGALAVQDTQLAIAGSGDIAVKGSTRTLDMSIAGSGSIAAKGLTAGKAQVSIAGSGDIVATVDGPAEVSLMGSGDVDLGPKARCATDKMGSGSVRCGN